jgi:hypothetical protein
VNKKRFVVISYDDDQQQVFWDWVLAEDSRSAREWVAERRSYAVPVECLTPEDLVRIGQRAANTNQFLLESTMKELDRMAVERGDIEREEPCERS